MKTNYNKGEVYSHKETNVKIMGVKWTWSGMVKSIKDMFKPCEHEYGEEHIVKHRLLVKECKKCNYMEILRDYVKEQHDREMREKVLALKEAAGDRWDEHPWKPILEHYIK